MTKRERAMENYWGNRPDFRYKEVEVEAAGESTTLVVANYFIRCYGASTMFGYSTRETSLEDAVARARAMGLGDADRDPLVSVAAYRTRVVKGPTGLGFLNREPCLWGEFAAYSNDLTLVT